MVTIINAKEVQTKDGRTFVSLTVEGEATVQFNSEGNASMGALKATIPANISLALAEDMVEARKTLPGRVARIECEPYVWNNPTTGEPLTLSHTYKYVEDSAA